MKKQKQVTSALPQAVTLYFCKTGMHQEHGKCPEQLGAVRCNCPCHIKDSE